jgi:ATP-binding protein involved in chromosome partitioning
MSIVIYIYCNAYIHIKSSQYLSSFFAGDIQITLSQAITFTGAVIVTTPHELSLADATKGVAMFEDLRVPTLAVVENMSYFECDVGTIYHPFGIGGRENLLR